MDVPNVLNSLIILVILTRRISPSLKIAGVNNLIEVFHHLIGEFGGEEGDSSPIIERVPCFISQGFKFSNESIDFPRCESEMTEFSSACSVAPVSWNAVLKALEIVVQ